jgi:hypothetical protein
MDDHSSSSMGFSLILLLPSGRSGSGRLPSPHAMNLVDPDPLVNTFAKLYFVVAQSLRRTRIASALSTDLPTIYRVRATCRIRTDDLPLTRRLLWPTELRWQYSPGWTRTNIASRHRLTVCCSTFEPPANVTGLMGLEPTTSAVTARHSNQLSYNPIDF